MEPYFFDVIGKLFETKDMQLIKDYWHYDYMHLTNTQLVARDNFEKFWKRLWEAVFSLHDPKVKPE